MSLGTRQGKPTCVSKVIFAVHDVPLTCDAFKPVWIPTRSHSFGKFYQREVVGNHT